MVKSIDFPFNELSQLQGHSRIITTRVSQQYNRYHKGDVVCCPWQELYLVSRVQKIEDITDHPYYQELTQQQIRLLQRYKRMDVITLKKVKTS